MTGTTPNLEALKQLRRVVEAAPDDERFDMRGFCDQADCGTTRCAAGWAAVDPWFRANTAIGDVLPADEDGFVDQEAGINAFSRLPEVFGITRADSNILFGGELSYLDDPDSVSKAEVIANIDRLIEGGHPSPYAAIRGCGWDGFP